MRRDRTQLARDSTSHPKSFTRPNFFSSLYNKLGTQQFLKNASQIWTHQIFTATASPPPRLPVLRHRGGVRFSHTREGDLYQQVEVDIGRELLPVFTELPVS
eukprot:COSAG03_NODE_590_length_6826_cov_1200.670581_3_plen_102_part_00